MIENILLENFNIPFIVLVNVLTYILIKIIDYLNKEKSVSTNIKRIVLLISIIILFIVYKLFSDITTIILINSAIAAPVSWDIVFRPIVKRFGGGYKNIDKTIK